MRIEILTSATCDPLLLDDVRTHLRTDSADDDATLATLARTAEAMMEAHLGVALIARDVAMYLDQFPSRAAACSDWWQGTREGPMDWISGASGAAILPARPLISLSKIEVWQAGGWQEWATVNYSASTGLMPLLHRAQGSAWPVPDRAQEGIRIAGRVGFGENWNAVPANLRHAMLQLVAWLYTHRGDEAGEDAMRASGAAAMVTNFRKVRL